MDFKKALISSFLLIICVFSLSADTTYDDYLSRRLNTIDLARKKYEYKDEDFFILVSVKRQMLYVFQSNKLYAKYPVSTSKYGIGGKRGSKKTPLGFHRVASKVGKNAEKGTVFRGLGKTERIAEILTERKLCNEDLVLTRVLWLSGLKNGYNKGAGVDSKSRYIYIHGTPEEGYIGEVASHGCIRMKNDDVIDLFNYVPRNTLVYIGF